MEAKASQRRRALASPLVPRGSSAISVIDTDRYPIHERSLAAYVAMLDPLLHAFRSQGWCRIEGFLEASATLVQPGGLMILATLNRTPKAFLLAIVGAEYLLRWLPRGTHDWRRFVRPSEAAAALRDCGLEIEEMTGVAYNPLTDSWRLAPRDLDVNYMLMAVRPAAAGKA